MMAGIIETKIKWIENEDGYTCIVRGLDNRTKRILSTVRINIPVYSEVDYVNMFGKSAKSEVEKSAIEIAKNIAEKSPE